MLPFEKMTIKEITRWLEENQPGEDLLYMLLKNDPRRGVQELARKKLKLFFRERQEDSRLENMLQREKGLWQGGYSRVAGVDEAGRGPLAGPVVAAAVILPPGLKIQGIKDSKMLPTPRRKELYSLILEKAQASAIIEVGVGYIDRHNIHQAGLEAMRRAVRGLKVPPDFLLTDGFPVPGLPAPQEPIRGGDRLSLTIACASILAKVYRDALMEKYHQEYPRYGFDRHKGYPTREHYEALALYGPSPLHRRSFNLIGNRPGSRKELGRLGELYARDHLVEKGYTLLEENYNSPRGEIDLVAREGDDLVFIEVRTFSSLDWGGPGESVNKSKQDRLRVAASFYLARHDCFSMNARFDVVSIIVDREGRVKELKVIKNAF